jgi:hypothetical protein
MAADAFTCFGELPVELRRKNWGEASEAPRMAILDPVFCGPGKVGFFVEVPNSGMGNLLFDIPQCLNSLCMCSLIISVPPQMRDTDSTNFRPSPTPQDLLRVQRSCL